LWVALGARAEQIAVVDVTRPHRPRLVRRFRPPFLAHDVGWTPDGKRVWVSSGDRSELAIYAARTGKLVRRLAADQPPQHFTFRDDLVYVASGESGTLRVHRVDGPSVRKTAIPAESYNVQQAKGWVVTPGLGTGTFCALDRHGRVRWRKTVARSSHDACIVTLS
jgi:outer membrane protein assembly factor BamB